MKKEDCTLSKSKISNRTLFGQTSCVFRALSSSTVSPSHERRTSHGPSPDETRLLEQPARARLRWCWNARPAVSSWRQFALEAQKQDNAARVYKVLARTLSRYAHARIDAHLGSSAGPVYVCGGERRQRELRGPAISAHVHVYRRCSQRSRGDVAFLRRRRGRRGEAQRRVSAGGGHRYVGTLSR